jgi:hypothetical protein
MKSFLQYTWDMWRRHLSIVVALMLLAATLGAVIAFADMKILLVK